MQCSMGAPGLGEILEKEESNHWSALSVLTVRAKNVISVSEKQKRKQSLRLMNPIKRFGQEGFNSSVCLNIQCKI